MDAAVAYSLLLCVISSDVEILPWLSRLILAHQHAVALSIFSAVEMSNTLMLSSFTHSFRFNRRQTIRCRRGYGGQTLLAAAKNFEVSLIPLSHAAS